MPTIAVIGGIGSGKSAVTALLAARGAAVVDADVIAREVVEPGSPTLQRLVQAFGDEIRTADGSLDRGALAAKAFADPASTTLMNEIIHPAIGLELVRQVDQAKGHSKVVVVAIPLFRPEHRAQLGIDEVWSVDVPAELAVERLVAHRGFTKVDAVLRMATQGSRDDRNALADEVIDNSGTYEELAAKVEALWRRLEAA
ncbi:MAG TPA: dephospho-CoA kinase [Acidimicrobiales bacterium]